MEITLRNVDYTYAEGAEETPMFRVAHCTANVKVNGFKGTSLVHAWSGGIKINTENFDCDLGDAELITRANEEFYCKPI